MIEEREVKLSADEDFELPRRATAVPAKPRAGQALSTVDLDRNDFRLAVSPPGVLPLTMSVLRKAS